MAKFTGELSGSLSFLKSGVVQTQMIPGVESLNLTGSLNITGSQLTLNGRNILSEIDALTAGSDPEVGTLRIHSGAMLLYTGSTNLRLDALESATGSISVLNAATSSYFLKSNAASIISSSTQIQALGFTKDDLLSGSQQLLDLGFKRDVVSGSQQILDLGFVTSSNIASYNDLSNVPGGIVSSSAQVSTLGFITASVYSDLVNIPSGIISGAAQVEATLANNSVDFGTGHVTASKFSGDGSGLTNLSIGQVTSIRSDFDATGSVTLNHNFNTQNINVVVFDENGYQFIPASTQILNNNSVKLTFDASSTGHAVVAVGGHIFSGSVTYNNVTNKPGGIISSSQQITDLGFGSGNTPAGTVSSSAQILDLGFITGSTYAEIIDKPSGIVSSSAQITALGFGSGGAVNAGTVSSSAQISDLGFITGSTFAEIIAKPAGIISSSAQITALGYITSSHSDVDGLNLFTGSIQSEVNAIKTFTGSIQTQVNTLTAATSSYLTSAPAGTVSSSAQIESFGFITASNGAPAGTVSSSAQISALGFITGSHSDVEGLNSKTGSYAVTASNYFTGSQFFSGSLIPEALSSQNGLYDLGSLSKPWRDLYITTGSLNFVKDGEIFSTVSGERNAIRVGNILITTASLAIVNNAGQVVQNIAQATVSSSGEVTSTEQTLVPSNTVSSSAQIESLGFITSSTSPSYDGNRIISNEDLPDLFNTFNPGTSGSVVDFLNAVFYPNSAPTITTSNQTIAEYTVSGSTITALAATDPEGQTVTFSLDGSYTDNFVVVEGSNLNLRVLPTATNFNTDDRGDGTLAHPVIVKATDSFNTSATKTIYIRVTPNAAPVFRHPNVGSNTISSYSVSRNENASNGEVTKIYFTDAESDTITINSGSDPNGHFSITKYSNYVAINQVTASLDYENITSYSMSITASDAHYEDGDDTDSFTAIPITISVTDNTQPSVNNQTLTGVNENSSAGATAGTISATDPEGDVITFKNARFHSQELDGTEVPTGSYGGTSQATDPTEDAFTISSTGVVTRQSGVHLNSDLVNKAIYEVTVTDAYNNGTDKGLISIPIADDTAATISGDTTLYVIESAVDGNAVYDNSNGYSGTTSRFTANQSVTWAVSSSNDFSINSSGYLFVNRDISGSATVGGDQIAGVVTATNSFGTETTQAFTVNITDNDAPNITFTNTSANLNTNKAVPGNNLVSITFSDPEGNNLDHNSFSASFNGHDLSTTKSGDTYLVRATSDLDAGNYSVTASIADEHGFATRTSSHSFTIAQAVVGSLTTNGTFRIIESAESGSEIKINANGRTGTQADLGVSYSPNYGTQAVSSFTSSNAAIVVNNNGNLSLGLDISGSSTGSGFSITSDITFQDQYNNLGSGSITVSVVANNAPSVTVSEQSGLETDTVSGSLAATVSVSDTESDYPITLTLGGANASSFVANSTNANGTSWNITASSALTAGTYNFAVTASDSFGKEGYDTATITVAQSADYGKVYVYTSTYGTDSGLSNNYNAVMGANTLNSDTPPQVTAYTANTSSPYYKFKGGEIGSGSISLAGGQTATLRATGSGAGLDQVLQDIGSISAATTGQVIIVYPSGSDMSVPTSVQESFNSQAGGAVPAMTVDGGSWGIESGVIHSIRPDSTHLGYDEWFIFGRKSRNAIASSFDIRLINASGSLPS